MALFDTIIRELADKFNLGGKAGALVMELLRNVTSERSGGLAGFMNLFKSAGLEDIFSSWMGRGENKPITPAQMETAVGSDWIGRIASKVGLSSSVVTPAMAYIVPKVIDKLTPNGTIPATLPPEVNTFLSGGAAQAQTVKPAAASVQRTAGVTAASSGAAAATKSQGGGFFRKLLPLLGLALLGLLAYWFFNKPAEQTAERTAPATTTQSTATTAPAASAAKADAQLALRNVNGNVSYAGAVPDQQSKTSIIDALSSAFGASNVSGDLSIDPNAAKPSWIGKLGAALGAFGIPGAEMLLKGNSINIGGLISDAQKSGLMDSLKSIFGGDFSIGSLAGALPGLPAVAMPSAAATSGTSDDLAAQATKAATEKSLSALQALPSGFSASSLADALNISIINFATGSAQISTDSMSYLREAANAIKRAPAGTVIEVGGHTDATGDAAMNDRLSQARAEAVREALIGYGVDSAMLTAQGYGGSRPVAGNDTPEDRFKNRRIEFTVAK